VGSAVNDTTRQVGGALGVAVLGSVMSSTYGPRVTEAFSGLPLSSEQATAIHDQIGAAMRAAAEIGGPAGRALADAASSGFADGMSTAFVIGASALVLGAVIVALFLPARARDHEAIVPAVAAAAGGLTPAGAVAGDGDGVAGDGHGPDGGAAAGVGSAPPVPAPSPDPEPR
jgi:hypothetical protein